MPGVAGAGGAARPSSNPRSAAASEIGRRSPTSPMSTASHPRAPPPARWRRAPGGAQRRGRGPRRPLRGRGDRPRPTSTMGGRSRSPGAPPRLRVGLVPGGGTIRGGQDPPALRARARDLGLAWRPRRRADPESAAPQPFARGSHGPVTRSHAVRSALGLWRHDSPSITCSW
jgi:hypothetical protein